jgi:hypothetical protein
MSKHLVRRVEALGRRAAPAGTTAPCFVLAADAAEAERAVERVQAEHPHARHALFVMTLDRCEPRCLAGRNA